MNNPHNSQCFAYAGPCGNKHTVKEGRFMVSSYTLWVRGNDQGVLIVEIT